MGLPHGAHAPLLRALVSPPLHSSQNSEAPGGGKGADYRFVAVSKQGPIGPALDFDRARFLASCIL